MGTANWTVDRGSGLPVFRVVDLPDSDRLSAFLTGHSVDRTTELALYAAEQAVAEAGWAEKPFSILVGSSRGPTGRWESAHQQFLNREPLPLRTSPETTLGSIGFALGRYFESSELSTSLSVTCSSGMHAIIHGIALLQSGLADRVLVGGAEAPLTPFTIAQMHRLGVYAPTINDPYPNRPLGGTNPGMVLGEGAAFLALSLASPGGSPGRITGIGFARERPPSATGITASGKALQAAMRRANGNHKPPDLILAHAPGTPRGDRAELRAIADVFPDPEQSVSSLKWATGHTFGASGPLALVSGLDLLGASAIPSLPYPSAYRVPESCASLLVNATGFGGNAASIRIEK
jgi:3-oxoacyl-(acyl-carrier-protein) synthase